MRVNVRKMKNTISSEKPGTIKKKGKFPCLCFSKGVSSTCIQTVECMIYLTVLEVDRIRMMNLNVGE